MYLIILLLSFFSYSFCMQQNQESPIFTCFLKNNGYRNNTHSSLITVVTFNHSHTQLQKFLYNTDEKRWRSTEQSILATGRVSSCCLCPAASLFATHAAGDSSIKIWNLSVSTTAPLTTLALQDTSIKSICFSPDGSQLAAHTDHTIYFVRGLITNQLQQHSINSPGVIGEIFFSPVGSILAVCTVNQVHFIRTVDNQLLFTKAAQNITTTLDNSLRFNSMQPYVRFSEDGSTVAILADKTITVYSTDTFNQLCSIPCPLAKLFCITTDGTYIAVGLFDESIQLWNTQTGQLVQQDTCPSGSIRSLQFQPHTTRVAIITQTRLIPRPDRHYPNTHNGGLFFYTLGSHAFTSLPLAENTNRASLAEPEGMWFCKCGSQLITSHFGDRGVIKVWGTHNRTLIRSYSGYIPPLSLQLAQENGILLISGALDQSEHEDTSEEELNPVDYHFDESFPSIQMIKINLHGC